MAGRKNAKSSHNEEKGSLGSTMDRAARAKAAMRRARYEADQRAFEQWTRQGFVSGFEADDESGPESEDGVVE